MSKTVTLSLPHDLTEAEVKRRLISAIADARKNFPDALKNATETWTDNKMEFLAKPMGQTLTGHVRIEPRVVHVSIELPFMLAMFAGKMMPKIEAEGRKLLERK